MAHNPQVDVWNGESGRAWTEHVDHFDHTLAPFGEAVLQRLDLRSGDRVLDIGCGVGTTTMTIATRVTPSLVIGADLSAEMLTTARARAHDADLTNVEFRLHDVQEEPFEVASFDVAFSRFGVMFFPDPSRAFANVRRGMADGGRLGFVCFQAPMENPMIVGPVFAAAAHVAMLPPPGPTEPSPFSLADPDQVRALLDGAGFVNVSIEPGPTHGDLGAADDIVAVARRALEQNPGLAPGLAAATPEARSAAVAATVDVMSSHVVDGRIVMGAATWIVTARTP